MVSFTAEFKSLKFKFQWFVIKLLALLALHKNFQDRKINFGDIFTILLITTEQLIFFVKTFYETDMKLC